VAEVNATSGTLIRRLNGGGRSAGLARTSDGKVLLVCDRGLNKVVFVDLGTGEVVKSVDVVREPGFIALTGDDKYAVVGNKLPRSEDARLAEHGAEVSIVELSTGIVRNVRLPGGSSIVRQIAISPDNRWAYVIHQAGRANTMVTQLDKGWVMTNCTSIIDIAEASLYTTFLFDKEGAGAANPWGVAVSPDGSKLWATVAGISELATVDLKALHALLADDQVIRAKLHGDLGTMIGKDLLTRRTISSVEGTRGIAVNPDGTMLAVAAYFEGKVLLVDLASEQIDAVVLSNNPDEDQIRTGERYYNSGLNCYQQWLSCATCHEGGRMDGLSWDLLNDGQGNPKNTRSHILSAVLPPTNVTGCRESALVSARAGYEKIEFQPAPEDRVAATYAFIQSLAPEPSPYLGPDGQLTPDAVEGKKIFESGETGCSGCHRPPLFASRTNPFNVGTRLNPPDISSWDDKGYYPPTLVEVWRTAPYLHLGQAITLREVVTTFNEEDKHGSTSQLSPEKIDQLVAYLMQIGPTEDVSSQADAGPDPQKSDAEASKPDPVDPTHDTPSGCICNLSAVAGERASASANWVIVAGMVMLMLTVLRRRRASRSRVVSHQDGNNS
jgi:DNA-binding beta-propeller fold protein YncE